MLPKWQENLPIPSGQAIGVIWPACGMIWGNISSDNGI